MAAWANYHGPAVKAANTRHAVGFFLHLAMKWLPRAGGEHMVFESEMVQTVRLYQELTSLLWDYGRFLPLDHIARVKTVCIDFGVHWMTCRDLSRRCQFLGFQITPKVHKIQHIPTMCKLINPAHVQCYAEESNVGTTTKVWKQSMKGRYQKGAQRCVLLKRRCGLFIRLESS